MRQSRTHFTIALTGIGLLGLIFLISLRWFSPFEALRFTVALPFLLLVPGFFITQLAFRSYDIIEKATLSVALSMLAVFLALFAVERTTGKLTPQNTAPVVAIINLVCALVLLIGHRLKRP